jgi:glycosyltransferase, MGT family protein
VSIHSSNPKNLYQKFSRQPEEIFFEANTDEHKKWMIEKGVDEVTADLEPISSFLNIYIYPEDLDYLEREPLPENFYRVDSAVRNQNLFELNVDLSFVKPGEKLIYFSLGSMAGADTELMEKMLAIFEKSKHKFVISKGPLHDRIKLRPNMVGAQYVNQIKLLPYIDLAIIHGGNNSFVETLYFAKPMIILPLFGDQTSNGERVEEKKIGKYFNPFDVTEEVMLNAIDTLLNDQELHKRLQEISDKMKNSKSGENLVTLCEHLALSKKV